MENRVGELLETRRHCHFLRILCSGLGSGSPSGPMMYSKRLLQGSFINRDIPTIYVKYSEPGNYHYGWWVLIRKPGGREDDPADLVKSLL